MSSRWNPSYQCLPRRTIWHLYFQVYVWKGNYLLPVNKSGQTECREFRKFQGTLRERTATHNSGWLRKLTSPSITVSFQSSVQWSVTTALIACETYFIMGSLICPADYVMFSICYMRKCPSAPTSFLMSIPALTGWRSNGHPFPCSVLGRGQHHSIVLCMHGRVECHGIISSSCSCAFSLTTQRFLPSFDFPGPSQWI